MSWLKEQGIRTVLTLTEQPLPARWLEGLGLDVRHIPIRDHARPDFETLQEAAGFISANLLKGNATLVHCLAGQGRTGCVLAAYLVKSEGMTASQALKTLRQIKPQFVETAQEGAVLDFGGHASGEAASDREVSH